MWERKNKSTTSVDQIAESNVRCALQSRYRNINAILNTMRQHPGEWHWGGPFYDYRFTTNTERGR